MPKFSIKEALKWGWQECINNIGFFALTLLSGGAVIIGLRWLSQSQISREIDMIFYMAPLGENVVEILLILGLVTAALKLFRREKPAANDFHPGWKKFWSFAAASVLVYLIELAVTLPILIILSNPIFFTLLIFVGMSKEKGLFYAFQHLSGLILNLGPIFLLLVFLMFILILLVQAVFQFYPFFIVDENAGPIQALRSSKKLVRGSYWRIVLLDIAFFGMSLLGALALGVGLFLAIPTALLAATFVYKKLAGQPEAPAVSPAVSA